MSSLIKTFPDLISTGSTHARKGNKLKTCTVAVSHAKISGEKGKRQADGSFKPGDLAILRVLVLDRFMDACRRGTLSSFPKAVIFFR